MPWSLRSDKHRKRELIKGLLFQSSIVKVIEFKLFDPEKPFTSVLPRLALLHYSNYAQAISFF